MPDVRHPPHRLPTVVVDLVPRRFAPEDAEALTLLLNSAYRDLQDRGLNFTAATQDVSTTRARVNEGACWVIEHEGAVAASLTMSVPPPADVRALTAVARKPAMGWIGQIAVGPELRGRGVAKVLFDAACVWARASGVTSVGLDTAVPAEHLAAMYARWGFVPIEVIHFEGKAYDSVVMMVELDPVR